MPEQIHGAVCRFYTDQNRVFPLSKHALFKIMREDGIIEQWDVKAGKSTKQKVINGKNARYLWIPRWRLDGGSAPVKQERMGFPATASEGFTEVPLEDVPKEMQ